jgi:hypothetical protein
MGLRDDAARAAKAAQAERHADYLAGIERQAATYRPHLDRELAAWAARIRVTLSSITYRAYTNVVYADITVTSDTGHSLRCTAGWGQLSEELYIPHYFAAWCGSTGIDTREGFDFAVELNRPKRWWRRN